MYKGLYKVLTSMACNLYAHQPSSIQHKCMVFLRCHGYWGLILMALSLLLIIAGFFVVDAHVQEIVGIAEMFGQPLERSVGVNRDSVGVDGHCFFFGRKLHIFVLINCNCCNNNKKSELMCKTDFIRFYIM